MKKIMLVILLLSSFSCTLALDILEGVYPEPNYMSIILHEERNYHNNLKPIEIEKIQMFKIEKIEDIAKIQKDIITQNPELQLMGTAKQSSQTPYIVDKNKIAKYAAEQGFDTVALLEVMDVKGFDLNHIPQEDGSTKYSFKIRDGKGYQFTEILFFSSQKKEAIRDVPATE